MHSGAGRSPSIIDGIQRGHEPGGLPPVLGVEEVGLCLSGWNKTSEYHPGLFVEIADNIPLQECRVSGGVVG